MCVKGGGVDGLSIGGDACEHIISRVTMETAFFRGVDAVLGEYI